jgi:hypothetical protein
MTSPTTVESQSQQTPPWWSPRWRGFYAALLMCIAVSATYFPVTPDEFPPDAKSALLGLDFMNLHVRRLRYVHEALLGPNHYLPAWYTRELGGTPFRANLQNFPLIPTRLPVLLANPDEAFGMAIQLAANLSAIFMFLYCRQLGIGRVGSAVAGYTFACSGFFASRVFAGHLPLLEAYGALPLLLWLIELNIARRTTWRFLALALAACAIALAGHPQIPVYAFFISGLYILWRARNRNGIMLLVAMILGIGLASFALYPMLLLIGRSTRVLALDPPPNDLAFPYGRLAAFLLPNIHGRMPPDFSGYPDMSYFWDTVCYVGMLPLVACAVLLVRWVIFGRRPGTVFVFITLSGVLALAFALPAWHDVMQKIPGTILRSPSRQIYITTFALAIAAGVTIDLASKCAAARHWAWAYYVIGAVILAHGWDLGYWHDRKFIVAVGLPAHPDTSTHDALARELGNQRIAINCDIWQSYNREIDDIGVFDSILLAKPYRALMEVQGAPARLNIQNIDGSLLSARANQFFGVRAMLTRNPRNDLPQVAPGGELRLYAVPNPIPRVSFLPVTAARFLSNNEIHAQLRDPKIDLNQALLLPKDAPKPQELPPTSATSAIDYQRPTTDEIVVKLAAPWPCYLRLIETWDPGWRATVDGAPAPLICAYNTFMAIPISAGAHEVRLSYHTPGATAGMILTGIFAILLGAACWFNARTNATP